MDLDSGAYDLAANRLTAASISVQNGSIDLQRQVDGSVNLGLLFAPPAKGALAKKHDEAASEDRPFQFLIKTVSLSGLQTAFSDLTVRAGAPVMRLDNISAAISDVDGQSPMKFNLDIHVLEGGRIKAAGMIDPSTPSVESAIEVAELALLPFQPCRKGRS